MGAIKTLVSIGNQHGYFSGGFLRNWELLPSADTLALLSRYRMGFHRYLDDYLLTCKTDDNNDPLFEAPDGARFTFYFYPNDIHFVNYTDLPDREGSTDVYITNNSGGPGAFSLSSIPLRSSIFNHAFDAGAAVRIVVRNVKGNEVFAQDFANDSGSYEEGIDLSGLPEGRYTVVVQEEGQADQATEYYIMPTGRKRRPFIILEMVNTAAGAFDYSSLQQYLFDFQTKENQWIYRIMLTKDYPDHEVLIEDLKETDNDIESPYPTVAFRETTGATDLVSGTILTFVSVQTNNDNNDMLLPFLEEPNKDLQVVIVKGKGNNQNKDYTYIKNIPNPSVGNVKPEIFINI